MTILQLVCRLNAISIETNKIEMAMLKEPNNPELLARMNTLNAEHNAIIRELCGRLPNLKDDENLKVKEKVKSLNYE